MLRAIRQFEIPVLDYRGCADFRVRGCLKSTRGLLKPTGKTTTMKPNPILVARKYSLKMVRASSNHLAAWLAVLCLCAVVGQSARGDEFPALCAKADGGQGNTSTSGINFANSRVHVGDTVQVFPVLGMVDGACQALHATGSVYIASGLLVTFLNDVTLNPGAVHDCPTNTSPPCAPGP